MKRKDDKVSGGPMFPRLHVNDTGKGGPRAPPRNKMALYEQLSIPSQRFNRGVLPLNPNSGSNSNKVPPTTAGQGSGHERNMFFPHRLPSSKNTSMDEESRAPQSNDSNLKAQFEQGDKVGEADDFQVPVFVHSGRGQVQRKTQNGGDRETRTPLRSNYSVCSTKHQNDIREDGKRFSSQDQKLRREVRRQSRESHNERGSNTDHSMKSARRKMNEPTKEANSLPNIGHQDHLAANLCRLQENAASFQHGYSSRPQSEDTEHGGIAELNRYVHKGSIPSPSNDSHSGGVHCSEPDDGEYPDDQTCGSRSQPGTNAEKSDDVSETSMVDSISSMDISPDDVVGIIGQKRFWKARRAIVNLLCYGTEAGILNVLTLKTRKSYGMLALKTCFILTFSSVPYKKNHLFCVVILITMESVKFPWRVISHVELEHVQALVISSQQRVFAVQVFELHRLIKVQKLIAAAPHVVHEDSAYLGKPASKESPIKKVVEYAVRRPSLMVKRKDNAEKANNKMECSAENAVGKTSSVPINQPWPYVGNPPLPPVCFPHAPGQQQWLVPVMTPSEGLVYKPYPGPAFVGPVPFSGNIMNPGYVVPTHPHQGMAGAPQMGRGYFPPYVMPVMNTDASVEEMNQFAGPFHVPVPVPQGQTGQISSNLNPQHQSSCNGETQTSGSVPKARKVQEPKGGEVQGSTAYSQSGEGRDGVRLGSQAQAQGWGNSGEVPRVIRVVPHNPRSATESAARIFQSIQRERSQYDSV